MEENREKETKTKIMIDNTIDNTINNTIDNTINNTIDNNIIISFDIGIKNLGCCILEYNNKNDNANIIHWDIHNLVDTNKKTKPSISQLSNNIFSEMDKIVEKCSHIDYVLLENQPSRINGTMKTIQMIIFSYFQLLKYNKNSIKDILLISPSKKTLEHPYDIDMSLCNLTNRYNQTKWKSIQLTYIYIENSDYLKNYLQSFKKKDDICDAFLQAISWLRKNNVNILKVYNKNYF